MMRAALIVVSVLWVVIFVATLAGADVFGSVYVLVLHQGLLLFALIMAAVVPVVFGVKLYHREVRAEHVVAICTWLLFLVAIYHEVILQKAFR